jgi:hypothetical protein
MSSRSLHVRKRPAHFPQMPLATPCIKVTDRGTTNSMSHSHQNLTAVPFGFIPKDRTRANERNITIRCPEPYFYATQLLKCGNGGRYPRQHDGALSLPSFAYPLCRIFPTAII